MTDKSLTAEFADLGTVASAKVVARFVAIFDACEDGKMMPDAAGEKCRAILAAASQYTDKNEGTRFIAALEKIAGTSGKDETLFMRGRYAALTEVQPENRAIALGMLITAFGDKSEFKKIDVYSYAAQSVDAIKPLLPSDYPLCMDALITSIDSGSRDMEGRLKAYGDTVVMGLLEGIRDFVYDSPHAENHDLLSTYGRGMIEAWTPRRNDSRQNPATNPKINNRCKR